MATKAKGKSQVKSSSRAKRAASKVSFAVKKARRAKKDAKRAKNAAARARLAERMWARVKAAAAVWGVSNTAAAARVENIRRNLKSLGTVVQKPNGNIIVYADKDVLFNFSKKKHVKGAKRRVDGECPLARALKDSFLNEYITHAHVGNHTVKLWNVVCPELVVKFSLSPAMAAVVREWDESGKWSAPDGFYAIIVYPEQSRLGPNGRGRVIVRVPGEAYGPRTKHPTRKITLQSDIALAMEAATILKKPKKKAA